MKRNPAQLSLFPGRGLFAPAPRSFSLQASADEIRICAGCGKQIITCWRTAEGEVISEFVSAAGECFRCAHAER